MEGELDHKRAEKNKLEGAHRTKGLNDIKKREGAMGK